MINQKLAQDVDLNMKFNYKWNLSDCYPAKNIDYHGTTVMSTFACGGGSTMGYKLAGFNVVAANDIDPQMAAVYKVNHNPKQFFECSVKELLNRNDLPKVDILDGSPPCSVFSMAGQREKNWQKDKKFKEGQAKQILDDLFFDFIKLAEKMQPKIIIAENVKGMLQGNAKWYTKEVVRQLKALGYKVKVFLLNAASMGVPQKRERVFFIAYKINKDINLKFNEDKILFRDIEDVNDKRNTTTTLFSSYWDKANPGDSIGKFKSIKKLSRLKVANTITASENLYSPVYKRKLNKYEISLIGSWPLDYNFLNIKPQYLIGMSVPPVMMAQVAYQVYKQLQSEQSYG